MLLFATPKSQNHFRYHSAAEHFFEKLNFDFALALSKMNLGKLVSISKSKWDTFGRLQEAETIPMQVKCENGHQMNLPLGPEGSRRDRWRCKFRGCRKDIGIRTKIWLEGSKPGLDKMLLFIYTWSQDLATISYCKNELGMNHMNMNMREVCAWLIEKQSQQKIGGEGKIVEIDESMFTRRKSNKGRVLPRQWVFGGICRETKEVFICCAENRNSPTLMGCIEKYIEVGTTIYSDCWTAYKALDVNPRFPHQTVNHSYNFVDPDNGTHTETVECMWREAKEKNKKMYGTHRDMLESYMAEFLWRAFVKNKSIDSFETIMRHISEFYGTL